MSVRSTNIDAVTKSIRAAAEDAGTLIVPAVVAAPEQVPVAVLSPDELATLIRHAKPRVVYLSEQTFDADQVWEHKAVGDHPDAKRLVRGWRKHQDQIARVTAVAIVDGVLNATQIDAPWYSEIETTAEALQEELGLDEPPIHAARAAADRKVIETKGEILARDPRFVMPKASKAKREHLAATLFPEVEHSLLWAIVEKAESILWLEGSS